jgi:hypothetical protein
MGRRIRHGALVIAVCVGLGCGAAVAKEVDATANAIIGGDRQAIIGGDRQAIIGGDRQAIIGGDYSKTKRSVRSDAIIGGDRQAIIGGDRQAIIGGDRQAIIGGDRTGRRVVGQDPLSAYSGDAVLAGPVDVRDGAVSILGRVFRLANQTRLSVSGTDQATGIVLGKSADRGQLSAARLIVTSESYVDGVSSILVTGKVTAVDPRNATMHVEKIRIDYSALLAAGSLHIAVGDKLAVVGVRPGPENAIQATGIRFSY